MQGFIIRSFASELEAGLKEMKQWTDEVCLYRYLTTFVNVIDAITELMMSSIVSTFCWSVVVMCSAFDENSLRSFAEHHFVPSGKRFFSSNCDVKASRTS
jgi:hypothetical protein